MSSLQEFKNELITAYLQTFAYDKASDENSEKFNALKKAVKFPADATEVVAYMMNQASFGKNKNSFRGYALFTKDTFYGIDINEKPVSCKLNSILDVTSTKEPKKSFFSMLANELFAGGYSEVMCKRGHIFSVTPAIGEKFKGFALINKLTKTDDAPFRRFMIRQATHLFGEIAEGALNDQEFNDIKRIFPHGAASFVRFDCKLRRLELDGAYYEIVIKDNKIKSNYYADALFTEEEWANGICQYISNTQILKIYQGNLKRNLALNYTLDQLHFESNVKITLGTRLKDTAEVAQYALDKMQDITERRMADAAREYEKSINNKEE